LDVPRIYNAFCCAAGPEGLGKKNQNQDPVKSELGQGSHEYAHDFH